MGGLAKTFLIYLSVAGRGNQVDIASKLCCSSWLLAKWDYLSVIEIEDSVSHSHWNETVGLWLAVTTLGRGTVQVFLWQNIQGVLLVYGQWFRARWGTWKSSVWAEHRAGRKWRIGEKDEVASACITDPAALCAECWTLSWKFAQ